MPFLLVAPFVVIIAGLVVIGLASMAQSQSSGFVSWLEQTLGRAAVFVIPSAQAIVDLTRWISRKLGDHFAGIERLTVGWIGGLYSYVERVGAMTLLWPLELFKVTYWLIWHEIPRMVKALPTAAGRVIHQTVTRVVKVERTIVKLPKLTRAQAQKLIGAAVAAYVTPYLLPLRWLRSHFHALTAVLPHTLPIPFGRTIAQIKKRLRRLERENVLSATAVAAVAFALTRLGLGWLRCNSTRRLGKRIGCGGFGMLESFFADAFEVFLATNLCTFIFLLQRAAEKIRPEMIAFVDIENVLIGCHGNEAPANLTYKTFKPPPVENALTLAV